jgi:diguanylate cyclase (GGDEF)-like protein
MRYSHTFDGKSYAYEALSPDGTVWATTLDKLVRFDPRSLAPRPVEVPLPDAMHGQIWYISFAPDGVLWATGRATVARYDGAHWRVLGKDDGVIGRSVTSVVAIDARDVWVGYNDLAHVTHFRVDSNDVVHAEQFAWELATTARDREGRVWFNGRTGLTIVARNGDLRTLGHADGLIWDDVGPDGVRQEADGSVYVATSRGLARLGPAAALTHPSAPGVALTSVQLGGRRQRDSLAVVPHDAGALSAFFTPLTLSNPDQVDCRYRLAGLEDQYTVTRQRQVQYRALPPGTYTLVVQCERESSGWTESPARFTFTVRPPWWDQWWARLGVALAIWSGVWVIIQLRTRALVQRRQELEVAVAARSAELVEKNHELLEMSLTDPLTRTRNRRYLSETIQGEISHLMRVRGGPDRRAYAGELTFMMVDIDGFKQVNDVYGHAAGDRFLQAFAQRLAAIMRASDVLIRWGGEEFLMICRGTDRAGGQAFGKRIIDEVAARPFDLGGGLMLHRTCSVGWSPFPWVTTAPDILSVENVIELADHALYLAKNGGRHQSVGILPSERATASPQQVRMDLLRAYPPDLVEIVGVLGNPYPVDKSA